MEQSLGLKWEQFPQHLREWSSKLLTDEPSQDIWFKCDGGIVGAHKIVLTSCSEWFKESTEDFYWAPHFKPLIVLWNTNVEETKLLLQYMYIGEVNVEESKLMKFLDLAMKLKVKGLMLGNEDNSEDFENITVDDEPNFDNGMSKPNPMNDAQSLGIKRGRTKSPSESRREKIVKNRRASKKWKEWKEKNFEKIELDPTREKCTESTNNIYDREASSEMDRTRPVNEKEGSKQNFEYVNPILESYYDTNLNNEVENPVKCGKCGKILQSRSLRAHMVNVHSGQTYECDKCGKIFGSMKTLKQHKDRSCPKGVKNSPNETI